MTVGFQLSPGFLVGWTFLFCSVNLLRTVPVDHGIILTPTLTLTESEGRMKWRKTTPWESGWVVIG